MVDPALRVSAGEHAAAAVGQDRDQVALVGVGEDVDLPALEPEQSPVRAGGGVPGAPAGRRQPPDVALAGAREQRRVAARADPVDEPVGPRAGHHAVAVDRQREHLPRREPRPRERGPARAPAQDAAVVAGQRHRAVLQHHGRPDHRDAVERGRDGARTRLERAVRAHHDAAGLGLRVVGRAVEDPPLRVGGLRDRRQQGGKGERREDAKRARRAGPRGIVHGTSLAHGAFESTMRTSCSSPRVTPPSGSRVSSSSAASARRASSPAASPLDSTAAAEDGSSG